MVILSFIIGSLVVGLLLYLPFFLLFRLQERHPQSMVSADLQASLRRAFVEGRKLRHETLSVEHLLLELLRDGQVAQVLRACRVDVDDMRGRLLPIVCDTTPVAIGVSPVDPQASPEFQRVVQRAIIHVQGTRGSIATSTGLRRTAWQMAARLLAVFKIYIGRGSAGTVDALVAVFGEKESLAVRELQLRGVTRFDVTSYIAHGVKKSDQAASQAFHADALGDMDVVLLNDDFTTMEFVLKILQDHFELDLESAQRVMLEIHGEGRAVCGRFAPNVAAVKVELVGAAARLEEHPLRCIAEPSA